MLQLWLVANTVLWPFHAKFGGVTLNLNVGVLILATIAWLGKDYRIAVGTVKVFLTLFVYVLSSSIVVLVGFCDDHLVKALLTMPILLFLVLAGTEIGKRARRSDWLSIENTAQWVILVTFLSFLVELMVPSWFPQQAGYRSEGKLSGLFSEPSHVALSLFPCLALLLFSEDKVKRKRGVWAVLGLLVLSGSSTLAAFVAAFIVYRIAIQRKIRQAATVVVGISLLLGLGAALNFERFLLPTIQRVAGVTSSSETSNVSSLVYVQGWQDAWFNMKRTNGIGLGLNMMGCGSLPAVSARQVLDIIGLEELNAEDGSFLFSKVVSECGIVGIMAYILVVWWWLKLERNIRRFGKDSTTSSLKPQAALIFCFVISSFIRGAGYFSGSLLLLIPALSAAYDSQKRFRTGPNVYLVSP